MTLAGVGAGGDSKTLHGWGGGKMKFEDSLPDVADMWILKYTPLWGAMEHSSYIKNNAKERPWLYKKYA